MFTPLLLAAILAPSGHDADAAAALALASHTAPLTGDWKLTRGDDGGWKVVPWPDAPPRFAAPKRSPRSSHVRLCILRHSDDWFAVEDEQRMKDAAAPRGALKTSNPVNGRVRALPSRETLEAWVEKAVTTGAVPGDTLVLHTVGHGAPDGTLAGLGQRKDFLEVLAACCAKHKQRAVWWQLSCHAEAGLPAMKDLTKDEQKYLTVVCSSPAAHPSATHNQARIVKGVLDALVAGTLDSDGDGVVTAEELAAHLNSVDSLKRGDLVKAGAARNVVFVSPAKGGKEPPARKNATPDVQAPKKAKTAPCSPQCVCGCNEGKKCECNAPGRLPPRREIRPAPLPPQSSATTPAASKCPT